MTNPDPHYDRVPNVEPHTTTVAHDGILRGWREMDTSGAQSFSDQHLLMLVSHIPLGPGWGLVAELMKRFDRIRSHEGDAAPPAQHAEAGA